MPFLFLLPFLPFPGFQQKLFELLGSTYKLTPVCDFAKALGREYGAPSLMEPCSRPRYGCYRMLICTALLALLSASMDRLISPRPARVAGSVTFT